MLLNIQFFMMILKYTRLESLNILNEKHNLMVIQKFLN